MRNNNLADKLVSGALTIGVEKVLTLTEANGTYMLTLFSTATHYGLYLIVKVGGAAPNITVLKASTSTALTSDVNVIKMNNASFALPYQLLTLK